MAQYRVADPEELMECPYERSHMVRAKRFQYHLVKCRKSYTGKDFQTCPFNAKHHIPKPEYRHHIATCPDKAIVEQEISYASRKENGGENVLKGCTDTPAYKDLQFESEEDWDAEISAPVRRGPAYDPAYHDRVQFKDVSGMTREQKAIVRDNRLTTQQKMEELRQFEGGSGDTNLRLPNTPSMVAMGMQPQAPAQPVSSSIAHQVARGRGRGVANQGVTPMTNGMVPNGVMNNNMNMPAGRGMAVGRGMVFNGGVGRGQVAPPPGFIVPRVNTE